MQGKTCKGEGITRKRVGCSRGERARREKKVSINNPPPESKNPRLKKKTLLYAQEGWLNDKKGQGKQPETQPFTGGVSGPNQKKQ